MIKKVGREKENKGTETLKEVFPERIKKHT